MAVAPAALGAGAGAGAGLVESSTAGGNVGASDFEGGLLLDGVGGVLLDGGLAIPKKIKNKK